MVTQSARDRVTSNDKSCALFSGRWFELESHAVALRSNGGEAPRVFVGLSLSSHLDQAFLQFIGTAPPAREVIVEPPIHDRWKRYGRRRRRAVVPSACVMCASLDRPAAIVIVESDARVKVRIANLVTYIESIQAK